MRRRLLCGGIAGVAERARIPPLGREPVDGASCLIGCCQAIPSRLLTGACDAARLRPPWFSGAAAARFSSIDAAAAVVWAKSSRDWESESESELQAVSIASERGWAAFVGGQSAARRGVERRPKGKFSSFGINTGLNPFKLRNAQSLARCIEREKFTPCPSPLYIIL